MSKEDKYDALGQRMKRYEEVANGQLLIPDLPLYARIDGRHFSKLTKNLGYPFKDLPVDKRSFVFSQLMQMTTYALMKEFKCDVAETHSDEISLGWKNIKTVPFDGKYFKIVSNIASYASTAFMSSLFNFFGNGSILDSEKERNDLVALQKEYPSFDCRIVQLPASAVLSTSMHNVGSHIKSYLEKHKTIELKCYQTLVITLWILNHSFCMGIGLSRRLLLKRSIQSMLNSIQAKTQ